MRDDPLSKKEQLENIENGRGIQYILNEAYRILGNPMLIHDMDYRLIASPDGVVCDDPIWNEYTLRGGISDETINFIHNEAFVDNVANSTEFDRVAYLISDKLKHDRIAGQICDKEDMTVAILCMVACETPFDDDTFTLTQALCDLFTKELGNSKHYQDYSHVYQESIIKKLIEQAIENKHFYAGHVANLYKGLKTNIFVAVADITRRDPSYASLVWFRDVFRQARPDFKYAVFANYIVALISTDDDALRADKHLSELDELCRQENIHIGISGSFQNLYELHIYYQQALNALARALEAPGGTGIFLYGD